MLFTSLMWCLNMTTYFPAERGRGKRLFLNISSTMMKQFITYTTAVVP